MNPLQQQPGTHTNGADSASNNPGSLQQQQQPSNSPHFPQPPYGSFGYPYPHPFTFQQGGGANPFPPSQAMSGPCTPNLSFNSPFPVQPGFNGFNGYNGYNGPNGMSPYASFGMQGYPPQGTHPLMMLGPNANNPPSLVDPATHGFHPSSSIGSAPNNSNTPLPPASDPSPSNPPPPARQLSPKAQSFVPSTTLSSSTPSTEVQSLHPPTRNALPGSFSTASTSGASANQGRSYSEDFRIGLSQAGTAPSRVIARVPSGRPVPAWADQSVPPAYAEQANSNRPRSTRPPLGAGGVAPTPLPNYRRETTSTTSSSSTPRPLDSIPRRRNGYLDLDSIPSSIEELRKGLRVPWNNDAQKTKGTVDRKRSNTFEAFQADATSKTLVVFLSEAIKGIDRPEFRTGDNEILERMKGAGFAIWFKPPSRTSPISKRAVYAGLCSLCEPFLELIFEKRISVNQALAQVAPPFLEMMNLQGTRKAASVSIQSHDEIYANLTPHERRICGTRTLFLMYGTAFEGLSTHNNERYQQLSRLTDFLFTSHEEREEIATKKSEDAKLKRKAKGKGRDDEDEESFVTVSARAREQSRRAELEQEHEEVEEEEWEEDHPFAGEPTGGGLDQALWTSRLPQAQPASSRDESALHRPHSIPSPNSHTLEEDDECTIISEVPAGSYLAPTGGNGAAQQVTRDIGCDPVPGTNSAAYLEAARISRRNLSGAETRKALEIGSRAGASFSCLTLPSGQLPKLFLFNFQTLPNYLTPQEKDAYIAEDKINKDYEWVSIAGQLDRFSFPELLASPMLEGLE